LFESDLFASVTIAPFFEDRGFLRVEVGSPVIKVTRAEGTQDFSVQITYPITEGPLYHWQAAEWNGDQTIPPKELESLTGMKPNDVANAKRIADGWEAVKEAYAHQGYIDAKLSTDPVLDDANRQVHYRVTITPGPQYRMGSFLIIGLPPKLEERLKERWKLKSGNVFDSVYAKDFVKKEFIPTLQSGGVRAAKISFQTVPNRNLHVVDFTLKVE
jgi:outer membrane protein assembly factor BamA